jgi:hypothetical protein
MFSVSLIDSSHNIVKHLAFVDEKGNYNSQKFPRKPDRPRKWGAWDWRGTGDERDGRDRCDAGRNGACAPGRGKR